MNIEITMDLFTARLALRGMRLQLKLLKQTGRSARHLKEKAEELASVISLAEEELKREEAKHPSDIDAGVGGEPVRQITNY